MACNTQNSSDVKVKFIYDNYLDIMYLILMINFVVCGGSNVLYRQLELGHSG